jgi:hypothetical protein
MTNYRLFPSTNGPSAGTSYSGGYQAGVSFEVTSSPVYLNGYWWWVCSSQQPTAAQAFALWSVAPNAPNGQSPALVAAATVNNSGTLTAGRWNHVTLPSPVPLTPGVPYRATTGLTSVTPAGFPDTNSQWGSGQPYAAGITAGPLFAYSDSGGSAPQPYGDRNQGTFALVNSPTTTFPGSASNSFNSWLDVDIADTLQAGQAYRIWPNYPQGGQSSTDISGYTLGMEFSLSQPSSLQKIWHWSPPGSTQLPTRCLIWDVATQLAVSGTDNASPAWSGAAGSGWIYCDYSSSGVVLQSGANYKVSTFRLGGSGQFWFGVTTGYWVSGGDGASGKSFGVISAPNQAGASPGQSSWNVASFGYPGSFSAAGENDWVDVEVTPLTGVSPPPLAVPQAVKRAAYY